MVTMRPASRSLRNGVWLMLHEAGALNSRRASICLTVASSVVAGPGVIGDDEREAAAEEKRRGNQDRAGQGRESHRRVALVQRMRHAQLRARRASDAPRRWSARPGAERAPLRTRVRSGRQASTDVVERGVGPSRRRAVLWQSRGRRGTIGSCALPLPSSLRVSPPLVSAARRAPTSTRTRTRKASSTSPTARRRAAAGTSGRCCTRPGPGKRRDHLGRREPDVVRRLRGVARRRGAGDGSLGRPLHALRHVHRRGVAAVRAAAGAHPRHHQGRERLRSARGFVRGGQGAHAAHARRAEGAARHQRVRSAREHPRRDAPVAAQRQPLQGRPGADHRRLSRRARRRREVPRRAAVRDDAGSTSRWCSSTTTSSRPPTSG